MTERSPSITIIGGGPAGLFAAETLASNGCKVTVFERKPSLGRKFLMAGRGGLNLTHSEDLGTFLARYGSAQNFIAPLINDFTPADLRIWCEELGQETFVGSSGRVFPKTLKASPLLRAWIGRLETLGVTFKMQRTWTGWNDNGDAIFTTADDQTETIKSDATLLALGGASWPGLGSDGAWVSILNDKAVPVSPLRPSNCGFALPWSDYFKEHFAGTPLKNISLSIGDRIITGEMMITDKGIEGGAVYALSSAIRDTIDANGNAIVHIDLHPHQTQAALAEKLSTARGRQSFATFLKKSLGFSPVMTALLREADFDIQTRFPEEIATLIKAVPLRTTAPFSIDRAISSAGGISLGALDTNLMIKNLPGVFAAGEMLDWEAPTGGYLLQASFATGRAAALGILDWLGRA